MPKIGSLAFIPIVMGVLCSSVRAGEGWAVAATGLPSLEEICFVSASEGWGVSGDGVILHTMDGGWTWNEQFTGTKAPLFGVHFITTTEGWVVGRETILHTRDGGKHWQKVEELSEISVLGSLADVFFLTPEVGWIVGNLGRILRTEDPLVGWTSYSFGADFVFRAIEFASPVEGWIVGGQKRGFGPSRAEDGLILHSMDGGKSWITQFQTGGRTIHGISFADAQNGWAVGMSGLILHTEDGGETWRTQESIASWPLNDVVAINPEEAWVVGNRGVILHTADRGETWTVEVLPVEARLQAIFFLDPLKGWTIGREGGRGLVLQFLGETQPEEPVILEDLISLVPSKEPAKMSCILGEEGIPWSSAGISDGLDMGSRQGWIQPIRFAWNDNLALRAKELGGGISLDWPGAPHPERIDALIDGDRNTGYAYIVPRGAPYGRIYLDLGVRFSVYRVVLWASGEIENLAGGVAFQEELRLGFNDGDPLNIDPRGLPLMRWHSTRTLGPSAWRTTFAWHTVFRHQKVSVPQIVRHICIHVKRADVFNLAEIEVYGGGFLSGTSFVSHAIDFGAPVVLGDLQWEGVAEGNGQILIRTRTGQDDDPRKYWRKILRGTLQTPFSGSGELLTREEYRALAVHDHGKITDDTENWSPWSEPYVGDESVPISSPDRRRYLQIKADFRTGDADSAPAMRSLRIEYSQPLAARIVLGEIAPTQVEPARRDVFTYAIRPLITEWDTGFDTLEIAVPSEDVAVRSVQIDKTDVVFESELLKDAMRLRIRFPKMDLSDDNGLLTVHFECEVFRFGTEFPGWVYDSGLDQFPQRVVPGDAVKEAGEDVLTVRIDLDKPLICSLAATPNPFTPNEDGTNDCTALTYSVLKLTAPARVVLDVFDLRGQLVRHLYDGRQSRGTYVQKWDGRDDQGDLLPPGIYVYWLGVDADAGHEARMGTVGIAY